jgi:hypothetical protein
MTYRGLTLWALALLGTSVHAEAPTPTQLSVTPAEVKLRGADAVQRLVVLGSAGSSTFDYSRKATYTSSAKNVIEVSEDGVITPRGNGSAEVRVSVAGKSAIAKVTVADYGVEEVINFRNHVEPVLTKNGCNAGGCHGKATGQNNFRLSLLGFDADYDYNALAKEARGRRVFPAVPEQSLLIRKATGDSPHGGGRRIKTGSAEYELLVRWIRQGMPKGAVTDPHVVGIECFPKAIVSDRNVEQQVLVTAHFSDGTSRDVTREVQFKSNAEDVAAVNELGLVRTFENSGSTAVMARYMGQVDVCRITIPLAEAASQSQAIAKRNYVDELVQAKWKQLNLQPSPLADDTTFLRRAYLDAIGTLPTPDEVRAFLKDTDTDKRSKVVDRLLSRSEYADFWAVKWGDLLRNKRRGQKEQMRGTYAFHAWIRTAFATNMPYDQFVRNIIAAQGTVDQHPPVIWYRTVRNLTAQTNDTAQLFLGTRINCAQCHHHPYEKFSQDDYYKLQAFFARMGQKQGESPNEPAIFVRETGQVRNPSTNKIMEPAGLDGPPVVTSESEDPRHKLVDWMAAPDNPYFARAIANRYWAHFMGRGLVDPVDDMRVTNPPTNPELLDALAKDFIAHKFDLKHLIRTIMTSSAYQLSSEPTPENIHDTQNYARAYPRRMIAEVLLDAVNQVAGTIEPFNGLPKGTRAIQLPDESVGSYFLDVFGRPSRETPCECERPKEANLAQALHLLNSPDLENKIKNGAGRLAGLLKSKATDATIVEELYLAAYGRLPRADEVTTVAEYVRDAGDRKTAYEDLVWSLVNSKEFLFNH